MKVISYIKNRPVFIIFLIFIISLSISKGLSDGDFDVFLNAAKRLVAGDDIYSPPHFRNFQYYYSPLFALILAPTTLIPDQIVKVLWLLLNSFFMVRIWKFSTKHFEIESLTKKQYNLWLAISIILMSTPILLNFQALQMTIFMLWSIFESFSLFKDKKVILGSSILALAINIKLLPIVIIPYLIYKKMYKPVIYVTAFLCIYIITPFLILGFEYSSLLHESWWLTINPTNKEHLLEQGGGFYSFCALIPAYFSDYPMECNMARPIHFLTLNSQQIGYAINLVRLLLILSMLIPLTSKIEKKYKGFLSLSYLCLLVPLIFPHQRGYSFFFIGPVNIFLTYYFLIDRSRIVKRLTSFILFVLSAILLSPIWGRDLIGEYIELYQDYKINVCPYIYLNDYLCTKII